MKKTALIRHGLPLLAALAALVSCSVKEELVPAVPEAPTHMVRFTSGSPETKTDMSISGSTASFSWTTDDLTRLTVCEDGKKGTIDPRSNINTYGQLVVFATFPGEAGDSPKTYTAVLGGTVGDQTPRESSYDESADLLIAQPVTASAADNIMFRFRRPVAINKMTLCELPAGETLKSVAVSSDKPLTGSVEGEDWSESSLGFSLTLTVNRVIPASGELTLFYTSVPAENAILTVDARVGSDSYRKTFGRGLTTTAGNVKSYSVGLEKQAHLTFVENFNAVGASTNKYGCSSHLTTAGRADGFNFEWTAVGAEKVFVFNNGVRLGIGDDNATGKIQNTTMLSPVPAGSTVNIKVYAARWGSDQGELVLGYNGSTMSKAPANAAIDNPNDKEYDPAHFPVATEFSIVKKAGVNTFSIGSSKNRIIIDKLEVEFYCEECGQRPGATVNTLAATGIGQTVATLNGNYTSATSPATATFFKWGATSGTLDKRIEATEGSNGSFSATITGLEPETTYYYQAYVTVNGTEIHSLESETFCGEVKSFTTANSQSYSVNGWLELPAAFNKSAIQSTTTSSLKELISHTHYFQGNSGMERNYTFLYDPEMYASYWVAYPLAKGHTGGDRKESFKFDPEIDSSKQTDVSSGYGVNVSTQYHENNHYARGHQIPDADRRANGTAQAQTYYATNMTPQIQDGFNGGIWSTLEENVRGAIPSSDTLYVVTGAAFREVNGSESITKITNKNDNKVLPVPNYYWKVVLKVKRSGSQITGALAVGFWLPHNEISGADYADYSKSVDFIEQKTGFDFFANLPDELESAAETNNSWSTFTAF